MKKIRYLLGIDGGGTKTEFLLTDINKNPLNRVILGAANPVNTGIETTKKILKDGISKVCGNTGLNEISVFAGLAGGGSGNNQAVIESYLSGFGFGAYAGGSDTDSALELSLNGNDGVVVIIGTGVAAFSQQENIRHRIGGWGYLIDKGGSGFSLGSDALDCAFRHLDGRGGSALMLELIENQTKKPLQECIPDIYSKGTTYVASFAPVVFEAFEKGDDSAHRIIDRNMKEVAQIIDTGCGFLNSEQKKVVICGGLCRKKEILEPFIKKYLSSRCNPVFTTEPMVNGAVSLAEKEIKKC